MPLPKVIIEKPPLTPAKFGILSAALVQDLADPHTAAGVQWQPDYCGPARTNLADCVQATSPMSVRVSDADKHLTVAGGGSLPGNCSDSPMTIDFGDGNTAESTWSDLPAALDHTYDAAGSYTVTISGPAPCNVNATFTIVIADPAGDPDPHTQDVTVSFTPSSLTSDDRADWAVSEGFELYHLSACRLPGLDDRVAYAERGLQLGEGRGVEEFFSQVVSTPGADIDVLASGASADPKVALARLEAYAFQHYGGTPVIYMNRQVASYLLGEYALDIAGDKLVTRLGSLVVAGAGSGDVGDISHWPYGPDGEDWPDGTWMYATGTLVVTRRPITTTNEVISNSALVDPAAGAIDNSYLVLAAREESIGWECFTAAHLVDPVATAVSGGGV